MVNLGHGQYSKCPPIARMQPMQAWRRPDVCATDQCHRHYSALFHTNSHISQMPPQIVHILCFSGRLTAPDVVMKCILVMTVL